MLARTLSPFSEDAHAFGEMGVLFLLRDMVFPPFGALRHGVPPFSALADDHVCAPDMGCSGVPKHVAYRDGRVFNGCA